MSILAIVALCIAGIVGIYFENKRTSRVLAKAGDWMKLKVAYLLDDEKEPEYIRLSENVTVSDTEGIWFGPAYNYFKGGAIYEGACATFHHYEKEAVGKADSLERAYQKQLEKQTIERKAKVKAKRDAELFAIFNPKEV